MCSSDLNFIRYVNGRARVRPLLETPQALIRLDKILNLINLSEIYIGLNDLRLGLGIEFMFELLSSGMVDYMANKIKNKKISFGFGGLARIGEGDIPAEMILAEHYRLGSNRVILSRAFRGNLGVDRLFDEIKKIREYEKQLQNWSYYIDVNPYPIGNIRTHDDIRHKVREALADTAVDRKSVV